MNGYLLNKGINIFCFEKYSEFERILNKFFLDYFFIVFWWGIFFRFFIRGFFFGFVFFGFYLW